MILPSMPFPQKLGVVAILPSCKFKDVFFSKNAWTPVLGVDSSGGFAFRPQIPSDQLLYARIGAMYVS